MASKLSKPCLAICDDMDLLQARGERLVTLLKSRRDEGPNGWKKRFTAGITALDGMIGAIGRLTKQINTCFG